MGDNYLRGSSGLRVEDIIQVDTKETGEPSGEVFELAKDFINMRHFWKVWLNPKESFLLNFCPQFGLERRRNMKMETFCPTLSASMLIMGSVLIKGMTTYIYLPDKENNPQQQLLAKPLLLCLNS